MFHLDWESAERIFLGSSFYSTGGGLSQREQEEIAASLDLAQIAVIDMAELAPSDGVCSIYQVGSASEKLSIDPKRSSRGIELLSFISGIAIKALFPREVNIEALAFCNSQLLSLPVLDADCVGGRAVPELRQDNSFLVGRSPLPLVAVTDEGERVIEEPLSPQELEREIRAIARDARSSVVVSDHPMPSSTAVDILTLGTISRSLKTGELLQRAQKGELSLRELLKTVDATLLIEGTITSSTLRDGTAFLEGTFCLEGPGGSGAEVYVKNENLIVWLDGAPVLTVPDLIIAFDKERLCGVHNSEIRVGMEILLLGIKATPRWRGKAGMQLFNPRLFGFDINAQLL